MYKWMKKTMGLALASLIGISLLAGCQKSESAAKGSAASGQEASGQTASGGEVTIGVTSFADTLEPTEQYFSWVVTRYGVGETLAKFDENGEIVPCLAKEWSVSEDQLTWTFKIREGVKFSNGK